MIKFSVVIPLYNKEKEVTNTLKSVLNQTYKADEIIVVDDGSTDNSKEVVKKIKEVKLIKQENCGVSCARNRGVEEAKNEYICFLDADDLWMSDKLEKQIKFMNENNLGFTYSAYKLIDEEDNKKGTFIPPKKVSYKSILKTNPIGCLTAIYDTQKLGKIYMPNILKRQDYGLWLKILKEIRQTKGILEPLAIYRIRKNSVSSNKFKSAQYQWKIYREVEKLNILKSIYYFIHYAIKGIFKY